MTINIHRARIGGSEFKLYRKLYDFGYGGEDGPSKNLVDAG
jgi:hypothetical protein